MEMSRIANPRQRFDVAQTMEELSEFACLMDRDVVVRLELQEAFCRLVGESARIFDPLPLVGDGALQAFGMRGGLRVRHRDGRDVTEETRASWPGGPEAFEAWRRNAEREANRAILAGPERREGVTPSDVVDEMAEHFHDEAPTVVKHQLRVAWLDCHRPRRSARWANPAGRAAGVSAARS
jgi:hypothetical protein